MLEFLKRLLASLKSDRSGGTNRTGSPTGDVVIPDFGLRQSEEHFSQLVSGVRDYAVLLLDKNGTILTWNAGAEQIKGYRAEEIIGQHISKFYTKDAVASGWPIHELKVAKETGRFEDEGWRVRKDGTKFWASVVITALRDGPDEIRGFLKITRDLTDRKQNEEKLRLSEERFRLIVEGVSDYAIYMLDPTGRVATWNAGAERLKYYTSEEIIGEHFSRFYPQEAIDRGWPEEELRRAIAVGRFEDEGWRVRKDGTTFWANVVITALRDEQGGLRGFAKVTRDLTTRRQNEETARRLFQEEAARQAAEHAAREIEQQREQLQVTLASIGDAVIVTDEVGQVTFLNMVASGLTGWTLQEAVGKPLEVVFPIIHEDSRESVENPVSQVFRERCVVLLANHTSLVAKNGHETPIEDSAAPIWDRDGVICGAVLVFRDVTAARRSTELRQHLAAIVESSDDAIIGQSLDAKITSWNSGAEQLYGYTAEETIGQSLSMLVPPNHPAELPDLMEKVKRGERIQHYETQRMRKDGTCVDVSLTISPVKNSDGKVIGASKIARDISFRKAEDRRKSEFLALLAHELRNPLAPLRNTVQILKMAGTDGQMTSEALSVMERQLQHLVRLVDDLMDVSRINEGKLQLRKERITIAQIVKNALEIGSQAADGQNRRLTVTMPDEAIYVDADKTRVAQAICNVLNNAFKYSDPDTPISLVVERVRNEIVIRVKDSGVGLPPQMLTRVFEMFTQVDRTLEKSQGGLGIGLSIVKKLIEMHGGSVEAHSEGYGTGCEFILRLPVATPPVAEATPDDSADGQKERYRILVVDDNVDSANSMAMILRMMGNDVRTAHDGQAGVEAATAMRPDMVLLDIGMPRLNGYDTCRLLRDQSWGKSMKIVALTGWGQDEDKRLSEEAGFDSHLIKPVEPRTLQALLADLEPVSP